MHWISYVKYILLLFPALMFSQTHNIRGYVFDDSTYQALPFATIRVENTDIVTSSNKEGRFILNLPLDKNSLLVSFIGYLSMNIHLSGMEDSLIRIGLHLAPIQLPEYFVVAANQEDPAMAIMREAIKRKNKNYEGLRNYEVTAYRRNFLYSGNRIAMVDEQFVKQIYNEKGHIDKDFILATHKTENIKNRSIPFRMNICARLIFLDDFNFQAGGKNYKVIFPLSDDAFQYYDFKLLNTKTAGKEITHVIQVIPRSSITPLLNGKIFIDDATYAFVGADIESNEGLIFPMVKNFAMKIKQTYCNYNGFWIPQYSEIELSGAISALGGLISMDEMKLAEVFSLSSCKVNGTIPDSVKKAKQSKYGGYTTDTLKAVSKLQRYRKTKRVPNPEYQLFEPAKKPPELQSDTMDLLRPLPLTEKEKIAFAVLDSTQTLDKMIAPKGILAGLNSSKPDTAKSFFSKALSAVWNDGKLHNNRVEGITPGAWFDIDEMEMDFFYNGEISYSTGLKSFEWKIGGGYNLGDDHLDRIDMNVWSNIQPWQLSPYISKTVNSILFSITGTDYFNYLRSTGFNAGIHKYFTDDIYAKIYFNVEKEKSVSENSFASFFRKSPQINPATNEGNNNTVQLQFGFDPWSPSILGLQNKTRFFVTAEYSRPAFGSDFNYQKYSIMGNIRMNSIYPTMFFAPYFYISLAGGVMSGDYGIQHLLTPPTALSFYAPSGVLKGVQQYELVGDKYIFVQIEHNWQTLPFTLFHANKLEESGIQIITGGSIANSWNSSFYYVPHYNWKPYWEAYFGLANLMDLLRIDIVHTSKNINLVRMSISSMIMN
ncbi:MAG: DUF5686 family protein [Bacteroidota bacterium]